MAWYPPASFCKIDVPLLETNGILDDTLNGYFGDWLNDAEKALEEEKRETRDMWKDFVPPGQKDTPELTASEQDEEEEDDAEVDDDEYESGDDIDDMDPDDYYDADAPQSEASEPDVAPPPSWT